MTWRDIRAELTADQAAELETLESNSRFNDHKLLVLARWSAAANLDDAMVGVPPPAGALWCGYWIGVGGDRVREYAIAGHVVGGVTAELRGLQRVDGSTERRWIYVVGDDVHLTAEQAHGLAAALQELAAILETGGDPDAT